MGRLVFGILKGGVVGAAIGYLASRAGVTTGLLAILVYAAIGAAVGLVCGRPLWRQDTIWTPVLKALFGIGVGVAAAFLGHRFLGGFNLAIPAIPESMRRPVSDVPALFGTLVGVIYGAFVEIDDAGPAGGSKPPSASKPAPGRPGR